jgi:electron transfer flavoprotein beta subunit
VRILSILRQVIDAEATVRMSGESVDLSATKLVPDTMDEYGVEQALRTREAVEGIEVIALALGPARCEDALRHALAMGADRAILLETEETFDAIAAAEIIAKVAAAEAVDLIFCGGQQTDWDSSALGPALAEFLGWPQATWTNAFSLDGVTIAGRHDTDLGSETFTLGLPAVITTQQGLNEPRYATLPNIMKARRKELRREPAAQYGIAPAVQTKASKLEVSSRRHRILQGADAAAAAAELVSLLRNEARVIA